MEDEQMSDDWSLKGKRVWTYEDLNFEDGSDSYAGRYFETREDAENNKWSTQYCYIEETIETLRKKLIADIQMELYSKDRMDLLHDVINVINKRFGYENKR